MKKRMSNPITALLDLLFDMHAEMGSFFKTLHENSRRLKSQINKYVQKRKSGESKSQMEGYDLLSVFLEDQEMFTDTRVVSNLISLIFAATETSQYTMQTIIGHLAQSQSKQSLEKLRQEFTESVLKPAIQEDPSIENLPQREQLNKVVTMDSTQDLEYTTMVMNEGLRFRTATATGQIYTPKHDLTLAGKYQVKPGDMIQVNFEAIHHDPAQWQRPTEFLPQRFDNDDPLSLTPSGNKRHVCSFIPFHGGSRVCFGKTLAEREIKIFTTMFTQKFDFKYEDEKYDSEIAMA